MSYTQKALVVLLGILLLPGLFLLIAYRPKAREYTSLLAEVEELDRSVAEASEKMNRIPEIEEQIKETREKLEKLDKQYPRTIEPFYKLISGAARKAGVDIMSMISGEKPDEKEENLAVRKHYVQLEARCSYRVLGEFLYEISDLPLTVSVSGLEIEGEEDLLPKLEVKLRLTVYLSKEEE